MESGRAWVLAEFVIFVAFVLPIAALSVGVAIYTRRAGYSWGPWWQNPPALWRRVGPARRQGIIIALIGFFAYLLAAWKGPVYLPHLILGADFALLGLINISEPMVPNSRLNMRWMGFSFVCLGLDQGILGIEMLVAPHHPTPLALGLAFVPFVGVIAGFVLAYVRAFPRM